MASISLDAVDKVYPDGTQTVYELSLDIADGEFMVFVGPSGCGKTTALRMIAGLEDLAGGDIRVGDRSVNGLSPRERDIAMVFQNYALYPHMTVAENMAFGLQQRKFEKADIEKRVAEAAAMLGLTELLSRKPAKLSGGQRQRVAMGRAIVRQPQAFLMDEPLSNLDARLRVAMRASLKQLHERLGVTTVYVTHDQVEAMTLADRAAVLCDGRLQQVDTPQRLFDQPANLFVAGFIGSPAMNLVHAELVGGLEPAVVIGEHRVRLPEHIVRARPGLERYVGHPVIAGIRPSDFEAATHADPAWPRIPVTATVVEELGAETNVVFVVDAAPVDPLSFGRVVDEEADTALPLMDGGTSWTARVNVRASVRQGGATELAVDPGRFHFFDPESGVAVGARDLDSDVSETAQVAV